MLEGKALVAALEEAINSTQELLDADGMWLYRKRVIERRECDEIIDEMVLLLDEVEHDRLQEQLRMLLSRLECRVVSDRELMESGLSDAGGVLDPFRTLLTDLRLGL